jgi:hypothetical protein
VPDESAVNLPPRQLSCVNGVSDELAVDSCHILKVGRINQVFVSLLASCHVQVVVPDESAVNLPPRQLSCVNGVSDESAVDSCHILKVGCKIRGLTGG